MVRPGDGGHIRAVYGEFMEVFTNEPETDGQHRSIHHSIDLQSG